MEFEVAVPAPMHQTFTYSHEGAMAPGVRVVVPFGRTNKLGVVIGKAEEIEPGITVKPIKTVVDKTPMYSEKMIKLGLWLAEYYHFPVGEVFKSMLPSSQKQKKTYWRLTEDGKKVISDQSHADHDYLKKLFGKRSRSTSRRREA